MLVSLARRLARMQHTSTSTINREGGVKVRNGAGSTATGALVGLLVFGGCGGEAGVETGVASIPEWPLAEAPLLTLGLDESRQDALFGGISDATLLPDGRLAVLERSQYEIRTFDAAGDLLWVAAGRGDGPGELQMALNLQHRPDGSLAVSDRITSSVKFFSTDGDFLRAEPVAGAERHGRILPPFDPPLTSGVAPVMGFEQLPQSNAPFRARMTHRRILLVGPDSTLEGPRFETGMYYEFEVDQSIHFGDVPFTGATISDAGSAFVVAGGGRGIQLLDGITLEEIAPPLPATPLSEALIEESIALHSSENDREYTRMAIERVELPDSTPNFDRLAVDGMNRIWVRSFTLSGPARWAVIERSGQPLGSVTLPQDAEVLDADGDRLLVQRESDLDVEYVEVWSLPGGGAP